MRFNLNWSRVVQITIASVGEKTSLVLTKIKDKAHFVVTRKNIDEFRNTLLRDQTQLKLNALCV